MDQKKEASFPLKAMNREYNIDRLSEGDIIFALNSDINGQVLHNEPSNYLNVNFPEGYKVIGFEKNPLKKVTYYFLTNNQTRKSSIGYVEDFLTFHENQDEVEQCIGCGNANALSEPLENTIQIAENQYNEYINDICLAEGEGLNFDENFPIKHIVVKNEQSGTSVYWEDSRNRPRFLNVSDLSYLYEVEVPCDDNVITNCIDIKKLLQFPEHSPLNISAISRNVGGNLRMGTYEYFACYCDKNGAEMSEYSSSSGVVRIFNENERTLDPQDLDKLTTFSIKLQIDNLDTQYRYYKVVCVERGVLSSDAIAFEEGIFPTSNNTVLSTFSGRVYNSTTRDTLIFNKKQVEINDLFFRKPKIEKAEGEAVIGNRKYIHGIKRKEEINIQPVVNLLSSLMKWQTSIADESFYKNGVASAGYGGYMRDEVEPFSLRLLFTDGGKSYTFPMIGRPANEEDIIPGYSELMGNLDSCDSTNRDYKWQYINTAKVEQNCNVFGEGSEVTQPESRTCIIQSVFEIPQNTIEIELNTEFDNLKDYIEDNPTVEIPEITPYLQDSYPDDHCTPVFGTILTSGELVVGQRYVIYNIQGSDDFSNTGFSVLGEVFTATNSIPLSWTSLTEVEQTVCDTINLEEFQVSIASVQDEFVNREESAFPESYERYASASCNFFELGSDGNYVRDTYFENLYMKTLGGTTQTALKRTYSFTNEGCSSADDLQTLSPDTPDAGSIRYFMNYRGAEDRTDLESDKQSLSTEIDGFGNGFSSNIQAGALWFRANIANKKKTILEISSTQSANANDDIISSTVNTTQKVRVSIFSKCSDTTAIYSEIFPIRTAGIQYKIERYANTDSRITLSGTSGSANITVNGQVYPAVFTTSLTQTATNFMLANGNMLNEQGIEISVQGNKISLYSQAIITVSVTNVTGTLTGTAENNLVVINNGTSEEDITLASPFSAGSFYVAVDPWINTSFGLPKDDTQEAGYDPEATPVLKYRTAPPDGCFGIVLKDVQYDRATVSWTSIILSKLETYSTSCTYILPDNLECAPVPFQQGEFAFWESTRTYPDNKDLYDSSEIKISPSDIPADFRQKFEEYYAEGLDADNYYILKDGADFRCQPIRHFKMPDNRVAPFMASQEMPFFSDSFIYPLGVSLDSRVVKSMIEIAFNNGLLTREQADNIYGFEILRGDNTYSKSVISNGIGFDMYKYDKDEKTYLYSNFPYNDLGADLYHTDSLNSQNLIQHPYDSQRNNAYTYIAPDLLHTRTQLGTEISVQGYLKGATKSSFTELDEHPRWTILGRKARNTANTLAFAEVALETVIAVSNALASQFVIAGVSTGASFGAAASAAIAASYGIQGFVKIGQYRYDWLSSFRNLGASYNFAYYGYSLGKYNNISINRDDENYFKPISISRYLRDGDFSLVDSKANITYNINNYLREESVFLSLGDNFLEYPTQYTTLDNSNIKNNSSKAIASRIGCDTKEFNSDIGSPYITMKNYVPDQFGDIDTVRWLTTGKVIGIDENNQCQPVFGGSVSISRFTYKRKIPFFRRTAFRGPDKTTYQYSTASNIAYPRFYCDYETDTEYNGLFIPFPDIDSDYVFDCAPTGSRFYIRPSKFYTAYYSVVDFLVESEMNFNYQYAGKDPKTQFYPVNSDLEFLTQEKNVSINEPNTIQYSNVYSLPRLYTNSINLPASYDREFWKKLSQNSNEVIWSEVDNSEYDSYYDPYLVYKPLNSYVFETDSGKLKSLKESTRNQAVARFTEGMKVFNTVDNLAERVTAQTKELGTGGIFATKPVEFVKSSLGFTGTQHHNIVETEFGDIHIDSERGQVIFLNNNANGVEDMAYSFSGELTNINSWFKKQLPFKILRFFKDADIDNPFKGLGISAGYDAVRKRLFLTKLDAIPVKEMAQCISYDPELGFLYNQTQCQEIPPTPQCSLGFTYNPATEMCERVSEISACGIGFTYNETTQMCEKTEPCGEGLDLVFIIDATSSQQGAIDSIKNAISTEIIPAIISQFGEDYRLGLVSVKDRRIAGQALFDILTPLQLENEAVFTADLNTVVASGGADIPEPTDMALEAVLNNTGEIDLNGTPVSGSDVVGTFRSGAAKAIMLITDNPPSGLNDFYNFTDWLHASDLSQQASLQDIQIFPYLTSISQSAPIPPNDPVAPNVTYLMQNYASVTGGTYYFAPSGSNISNGIIDAIVNNIGCKIEEDPECNTGCSIIGGLCTCIFTEEPTFEDVKTPIEITDTTYFEDRSWTISFKFEKKGWNSYFTSHPNYYNSHQDFFQRGFNSQNSKLWSHTLENTSFQVFEGDLKPFIVDMVYANKNVSKLFDNFSINSEALRYQDNWSFSQWANKGFNKINISNNTNNSGIVRITEQKTVNDIRKYPITNLSDNNQTILYTPQDEKQYINYFFNRVKKENRNIPQWLWDDNNIFKTVNNRIVNFSNQRLLERMRGDSFIIRLENDEESRFKINLKNTFNTATYDN